MLLSLSGRNFFTFKEFYVEFSGGMNVITGESGAGKTVFLKALWAVIGYPPSWEGEDRGSVEGNFTIEGNLIKRLAELGIEIDEDQLFVGVSFTGQRTIYRLNGHIVSRQIVQLLFKDTIEIHSQHSNVSLLDSAGHYKILDHSLEGELCLTEYRELYADYSKIKRELESMEIDPAKINREIDFLTFQINEIEEAFLKEDEDVLLEARYKKYKNAKFLLETFRELGDVLKDGEISVYNSLNDALSLIMKVEGFGYSEWLQNLQVAIEEMESLYNKVSDESDLLEIDDEEFKAVEDRMTVIQGLKRKYGQTVSDILKSCEAFRNELELLQELEGRKGVLEKSIEAILEKLKIVGKTLDKRREERGIEIAKDVRSHLEDLKMKGAELRFQLQREEEPKSYGISKISMLVKTNPGMDFMEIGRVASGGELSRYLLALESALQNQLNMSVIVFDEVDSGVGQRLGAVVADKLLQISSGLQTIVITHLPQIAEKSERHFAVRKEQSQFDTISVIEQLSGSTRDKELEEMSGQTGQIER